MAVKEINLDNVTKNATQEEKLAAKFVNCVMKDGKKNAARKAVKDALLIAQEKIGEPGLDIFKKAIDNIRPAVEVNPGESVVQLTRYRLILNPAGKRLWLFAG